MVSETFPICREEKYTQFVDFVLPRLSIRETEEVHIILISISMDFPIITIPTPV